MRFDDAAYVDRFNHRGTYPRIHDPIKAAIESYPKSTRGACDLGACTGLLAHWMTKRFQQVLAVEPRAAYRRRAVSHPRLWWHADELNDHPSHLARLYAALTAHDVVLVAARRVFPEIGERGARAAAEMMRDAGVDVLILEGRTANARSTDPLRNADLEVAALAPAFVPAYAQPGGNVRILLAS